MGCIYHLFCFAPHLLRHFPWIISQLLDTRHIVRQIFLCVRLRPWHPAVSPAQIVQRRQLLHQPLHQPLCLISLPLPRLIQPSIQIPQRRRKRLPACRCQRLVRQLAELVLVICQIRHRAAQPRHRRGLAQACNAAWRNRPVINLRLCKYL